MVRQSARWLLGMIFLAGLSVSTATAFDETRDAWIRGIFTGNSPRVLNLSEAEAWRQAVDLAESTPGAFILVGTGRSMQPLYPAGTILVLCERRYSELCSGQTVVYRNQKQRAVGHVLVAKARDGWRVRGLNNRTHDPEPVVPGNLVGVVVGAFLPERSPEAIVASARRPAGRAIFLSEGDR